MQAPVFPVNGVKRTAFYFESQGESLFAWLHEPAGKLRGAHAVVICAPHGVEQLNAHRAIRHLADAVAAKGYVVVRFDYAGTGDSSGVDEDPRRVETWLANICDLAEWTRQRLGCQQVSLIGLRVGAALATLAATHQAFDNLVLWAPFAKGSRYCRELKAVSLMAEAGNAGVQASGAPIKAAGFVTTQETLAALNAMDLLQAQPRCARALIVDRHDAAANTQLRDHLLGLGLIVEHMVQPGYVDMMAEPHYTRVPVEAITHMGRWLGTPADAGDATSSAPLSMEPISFTRRGQSMRERICPISNEPDLFGILCEPLHCTDDARPLIVLLSAGTAHHIGPGRLYVQMARQLAANGFRSLRIDICGVGDSVNLELERENDPYASSAFRDIHLVLRYAQEQCGARRVVLCGLCSGAYYAFQSAAQFSDPALVESLLINPRTYFWGDGMSLGDTQLARVNAMHYYRKTIADPKKWLRLLSGNSDAGIWGGIQLFVRRMLASPKSTPSLSSSGAPATRPGTADHPVKDDLPADLKRVTGFGRRLALFCATTDPGHFLLMYKARRQATQMHRSGKFAWVFIENADHTFSDPDARQRLIDKVTAYLNAQYGVHGASSE